MNAVETMEPQVERPVLDERKNTAVLRDLISEVTLLFQQELALAKAEMSEKASIYARNIAYLAIGGMIAYAGLLALITAGIAGLIVLFYRWMDWYHAFWLSALIGGIVVGIVGWIFVQKALTTLKETRLTPDQTVQTLQENKEWLRQKVK